MRREYACSRFNLKKCFNHYNETRSACPYFNSIVKMIATVFLAPILHIFNSKDTSYFIFSYLFNRIFCMGLKKQFAHTKLYTSKNRPNFGSFVCKRVSPWSHSWNNSRTCLRLPVAIVPSCSLTHLYTRVWCVFSLSSSSFWSRIDS